MLPGHKRSNLNWRFGLPAEALGIQSTAHLRSRVCSKRELRWATFACIRERRLEAPPGFEPGMEVLQTSALPLGDGAGRNWGSKLTGDFRPRLWTGSTATGRRMVEIHSGFRIDQHRHAGAATGRVFQAPVRGAERASKRPRNEAHQQGPQAPTSKHKRAERRRRRSAAAAERAGAATGRVFQAPVRGVERASKRPRNEAHEEPQARLTTVARGAEAATKRRRSGARRSAHRARRFNIGAGNGIRTRDFDLGKVALYH